MNRPGRPLPNWLVLIIGVLLGLAAVAAYVQGIMPEEARRDFWAGFRDGYDPDREPRPREVPRSRPPG